jgi:pyruvate/oxaloacetate carboxyltransferase
MKVIFETNARQHLLQHLGFNAETIAAAANQFTEKTSQNGVDLLRPLTALNHPRQVARLRMI